MGSASNTVVIFWVIVRSEWAAGTSNGCPRWVIAIRDQCQRERVPFFFKQWGGRTPKAVGRLLEGEEHNALPAYMAREMNDAAVSSVAGRREACVNQNLRRWTPAIRLLG